MAWENLGKHDGIKVRTPIKGPGPSASLIGVLENPVGV